MYYNNINTVKFLQLDAVNNPFLFFFFRSQLEDLSSDDIQIDAMKHDLTFSCAMCDKTYIHKTWLKKHLVKRHNWNFHEATKLTDPDKPMASFLRMSLLYRDTCLQDG